MEKILAEAQRLHIFSSLDIQFAHMLAKPTEEPALVLASACLSADTSAGHVCLPLTLLTPEQLFNGRMPNLAKEAWLRAGSPSLEDWHFLLNSKAVSDGSYPTPLVLDNQRLYLQRMWNCECTVAQFFNKQQYLPLNYDENNIAQVLTRYFPKKSEIIDWQKVAAAVAITSKVSFISGGPGTGKTSTVAKLLASLLDLNRNNSLRILIAAPTGKAAVNLNESINLNLNFIKLDDVQKRRFPREAITIHYLLGMQPNSQKTIYHRENQLNVDILIIDEASMVDLIMMANLITALPSQAKVIFLGDRYQLSSVNAGSVFGDICKFTETGYSQKRCEELSRLTGFTLTNNNNSNNYIISDNLCLMRKSYRFNKGSGISQLASAINSGKLNIVKEILSSSTSKDIFYIKMRGIKDYLHMLNNCANNYKEYLKHIQNHDTPVMILDSFNRFRLLCALRDGPFGVTGLNNYIEQTLFNLGLIILSNKNIKHYYSGKPIMILRNTPLLGLYNGDVGILLPDYKNNLRVYFLLPNRNIKTVSLSRLPEHETAFAMTVHKSQGSEFYHTALILPNQILPVLTRELLYTAVTRARGRLSLYMTDEVLKYTIKTKTQRRSGLIERLNNNNKLY